MMSAIQCHPKLKPMYERMVAEGKPKKVAIVACMLQATDYPKYDD